MHAISSYRGNKPTKKQTHKHTNNNAYAPKRHSMHLANATDLPGNVDRVDRGSSSVVPKMIASWSIAPSLVVGHLGPFLWSDAAAHDGQD